MGSQSDAIHLSNLMSSAHDVIVNGRDEGEVFWAEEAYRLAEILMLQTGYSHRKDRPGRLLEKRGPQNVP